MANSVDTDLMPHSEASDLGLHCLLRPACPNIYGYYGISNCRVSGLFFIITMFYYYCFIEILVFNANSVDPDQI